MLKKLSMFLVLFCAVFAFAQIKPSFQAFDADYLKLDEAEHGYHHFKIQVSYAPWAFVAEGQVKAPQGDIDLLCNSMDNDQLYIEGAYAESPVGGSAGSEYQAGIYDVMIYYSDGADEFPTKIKDLKVSLLPPIANDSWATGSLADAQEKRGTPGSVFKNPENADAIFQASARPLSKAQAQAARKAAIDKQRNAEKARRDSIAAAKETAAANALAAQKTKEEKRAAVKARNDSIAAARRAEQQAAQQKKLTPREQKQQAVQARQQPKPAPAARPAPAGDPCDQPGLTPLQKKRCKMNRK